MTQSLAAFLAAERQQESGGNYRAVNASSGALGAYQVMPANVASWTERALGHSLTASQYLASNSAQDAVANTILGGYYSRYGPAGAAAMWYSGQPDPNKSYGDPPVSSYVASVLAIMNRSSGSSSTSSSTGSTSSTTDASSTTSDCLWSFDIPVVGTTCVLTQGQGRAITGALLLAASAIIGGAGLLILASYGLKKSGALDVAASAASAIPGAGGAAARLASGAARVKAAPTPRAKPAPAKGTTP